MDKTIENIKKILHLGGSKPGKKNEKSDKIVSFSPAENGRVNHHTVTASVEVSRDQAERRWVVNRAVNVASSSCQISRTGLQSTLLQRLAAVWLLQAVLALHCDDRITACLFSLLASSLNGSRGTLTTTDTVCCYNSCFIWNICIALLRSIGNIDNILSSYESDFF